jgi:hypothetical protein
MNYVALAKKRLRHRLDCGFRAEDYPPFYFRSQLRALNREAEGFLLGRIRSV